MSKRENPVDVVRDQIHQYEREITFSRSINAIDTVRLEFDNTGFDFDTVDSRGYTIRFKLPNGSYANHWIEEFNTTNGYTLIWIRPTFQSGITTMTMVYSPLEIQNSHENGPGVFFDHIAEFEGSLGDDGWQVGSLNNVTVGDGLLKITNPTTGQSDVLSTGGVYNNGVSFDPNNSFFELKCKNAGDLGSASDYLVFGVFENVSGNLNQYKCDFNPAGAPPWDLRLRSRIGGSYERTATTPNGQYSQNVFYKFGIHKDGNTLHLQDNYISKTSITPITNISPPFLGGFQVNASKTWHIEWVRLRIKNGDDVTTSLGEIDNVYIQTYVKLKRNVVGFECEFDMKLLSTPSNKRLWALGQTNNFQNNTEVSIYVVRESGTQIRFGDIDFGIIGTSIPFEQGLTKYRVKIVRKNIGGSIRKDARTWIYLMNLTEGETEFTLHATYDYGGGFDPKSIRYMGYGEFEETKSAIEVTNVIFKEIVSHEI